MFRQPASAANPCDSCSPVVTPEIAAEAAVWVARLHGPDRSPRMERECLDWQALSPVHREAFERCTDTWEDVARVTLINAYAASGAQRSGADAAARARPARRARWAPALGAVAAITLGALFVQHWREAGVYATHVGEQRVVVLDDGSRMSLNTHSRVHVDMAAAQRVVRIEEGEVIFEVAKDPRRPFLVRARGSEVVALGTTFAVRLTTTGKPVDDALAVTLIEGQVTVRPAPGSGADRLAPPSPLTMKPGERVRLANPSAGAAVTVQVDRPRIEGIVAWKRSEAVFDDVSLSEAIAEVNRYDRTQIVLVGDASLARLRVSGMFRTGDTEGFARNVAALHGLVVRERPGRLELAATR